MEAAAEEVCVLLSRDIIPYQEALAGFQETYPGKTHRFVLANETDAALAVINAVREHPCPYVLALGSKALKLLKIRAETKTVIYAMILNPESTIGTTPSITGVHLEPSVTDVLATIRRILPKASRIGVLYTPNFSAGTVIKAKKAALSLGLEIVAMEAENIGSAVRTVPKLSEHADVLWMLPDATTSSQKVFEAMLAASFKRGIPLFALSQKHVNQGALAALSTDYRENGRQAAEIAVQLNRGQRPQKITPRYARKTGLVLNMGTAQRLGLTIPEKVQRTATLIYR